MNGAEKGNRRTRGGAAIPLEAGVVRGAAGEGASPLPESPSLFPSRRGRRERRREMRRLLFRRSRDDANILQIAQGIKLLLGNLELFLAEMSPAAARLQNDAEAYGEAMVKGMEGAEALLESLRAETASLKGEITRDRRGAISANLRKSINGFISDNEDKMSDVASLLESAKEGWGDIKTHGKTIGWAASRTEEALRGVKESLDWLADVNLSSHFGEIAKREKNRRYLFLSFMVVIAGVVAGLQAYAGLPPADAGWVGLLRDIAFFRAGPVGLGLYLVLVMRNDMRASIEMEREYTEHFAKIKTFFGLGKEEHVINLLVEGTAPSPPDEGEGEK